MRPPPPPWPPATPVTPSPNNKASVAVTRKQLPSTRAIQSPGYAIRFPLGVATSSAPLLRCLTRIDQPIDLIRSRRSSTTSFPLLLGTRIASLMFMFPLSFFSFNFCIGENLSSLLPKPRSKLAGSKMGDVLLVIVLGVAFFDRSRVNRYPLVVTGFQKNNLSPARLTGGRFHQSLLCRRIPLLRPRDRLAIRMFRFCLSSLVNVRTLGFGGCFMPVSRSCQLWRRECRAFSNPQDVHIPRQILLDATSFRRARPLGKTSAHLPRRQ